MNELSTVNKNMIESAVTAGGIWSTATLESEQGKKLLFKATQGVDNKLADYLNTPIEVANVMFIQGSVKVVDGEGNTLVDEDTGELITRQLPMTVLIDTNGKSYGSMATGVFRSACALVSIFAPEGHLDEPITVIPRSKPCEKGHTYVLEVE